MDLPTLPDLRLKLVPELVSTYIPQGTAATSGSVFNARGRAVYDRENHRLWLEGQCSVFDPNPNHPRPQAIATQAGNATACAVGEAYYQFATDTVELTAGKKVLEFSSALFTSPGNPSLSGLSLISPLLPMEGVWGASARYVFSSQWSAQLGTVLANPYLRLRHSADRLDSWLLVADRFVGFGNTWQATEEVQIYQEANAHLPTEKFGKSLRSDWLLGAQWSPGPVRFAGEYFHYSYGAEDPRASRQDAYRFPVPTVFQKPAWGIGSFHSKDLFFVDIRHASRPTTPYLSTVISACDGSSLNILGFQYQSADKDPWRVGVEWRHFAGAQGSEFRTAAKYVGENQLWLTLAWGIL